MRLNVSMVIFFTVLGLVALRGSTARGVEQGTQAPAAPAAVRPPLQTFDTTKPMKLEIVDAVARYKVQEQLVGISFSSDAVGTTQSITGMVVINPDGVIRNESRLSVDLRTLKSDQETRDNYLRTRTLETDKFPTMEFMPKKTEGLPIPVPSPPQAQAIGFQLVGDMTLHGVTKPATWSVIATLRGPIVAGRATTNLSFADFNITKPSVALLLSAEDKIQLEIEFRMSRSVL